MPAAKGPAVLKGWAGNRVDSPVALEITDELALRFLGSTFYSPSRPIYLSAELWVAATDGLNLAWDPREPGNREALEALYWRIRRMEPEPGPAQ